MTHSSQLHGLSSPSAQEYLEGWKRARAQLSNLRQRMDSELLNSKERVKRNVVEELLSVADNFRSLAAHVPPQQEQDPWTQGVLHISRQFEQALGDLGVKIINPAGQAFDPAVHEAVEKTDEHAQESGTIVEVLQPGYALGDTVMRPAKVKVAA
ncbi:MAG: nucleotide exchange factor GrpE [Candidatus Andersenbacteria bacterium]